LLNEEYIVDHLDELDEQLSTSYKYIDTAFQPLVWTKETSARASTAALA
jgi:hypothetical protein